MFRKKKGIRLSYNEQGLVYFYCACYKSLSRDKRLKIERLCEEIGGASSSALLKFITHPDVRFESICMKYFISEKALFLLRAKFYEEFWRRRLFDEEK